VSGGVPEMALLTQVLDDSSSGYAVRPYDYLVFSVLIAFSLAICT
jgi:hypothetical protein